MATELLPSEAPPAPVPRPRVVMVAAGFAAAAIGMYFAGLFGVYLAERAAVVSKGGTWLPEDVTIPLTQPNVMLLTLIVGSVVIQWAVDALANDDRQNAYLALGLSVVIGVAYLNMSFYLFNLLKLDVATSDAALLIYTVQASHMVLMAGVLVMVGLMAFRALGGQYTSRQHDGVSAAALLWHLATAVFFLIWILVYVTK